MKQRKHKTERKQESPDQDFMLDTDQSTPLVIKRETLSRDCENGETPRWASQKYNESLFSSPPTNIEKFLSAYASPPSDRVVYSYVPSDIVSPTSCHAMAGQTTISSVTDPLLTDQFKNFIHL